MNNYYTFIVTYTIMLNGAIFNHMLNLFLKEL